MLRRLYTYYRPEVGQLSTVMCWYGMGSELLSKCDSMLVEGEFSPALSNFKICKWKGSVVHLYVLLNGCKFLSRRCGSTLFHIISA